MGLTIWLYCTFNGDAEIISYFMRHYSPVVDRLIMFDNESQDNCREIISHYANAEIRDYHGNGKIDHVAALQFANSQYKEARGHADWVIWPDCDEFLWTGKTPLRSILEDYKKRGIRVVSARGYQMLSDHFQKDDGLITDMIKLGVPDDEYSKTYIFDPDIDLQWRPGRHTCNVSNAKIHESDIKLLHYRYLGEDYFARRNANNFAGQIDSDRAKGYGYHFNPDYTTGKYSAAWFRDCLSRAEKVIED